MSALLLFFDEAAITPITTSEVRTMTPASALLKPCVVVLAVVAATGVAADVIVDPAVIEAVGSGRAHVIVELRLASAFAPEGELTDAAVSAQREAIEAAQRAILAALASSDASVVRQYETLPFLALEIDEHALADLRAMPQRVIRILEDDTNAPMRLRQ
jgi:hypothetical protein